MEICSNTKCHESAVAAVSQSISKKTMFIYPIDRIKAGNIVYLCAKHALSTKPMRGWKVVNNFHELEDLDKNLSFTEDKNTLDGDTSKKDPDNGVIHASFTKSKPTKKGAKSLESKQSSKQNGLTYNLPPRPVIPDDDMTVLMREVTANDINLANGKKAEIPAHLKGMQKGPFTAVRSGQTEMLTILGFPKDSEKSGE